MRRVLVTGANGFVGRCLYKTLLENGYEVGAAVRRLKKEDVSNLSGSFLSSIKEISIVGDINANTDWSSSLAGMDTVIHLAARVHILQEMSKNPLESFRVANVEGSEQLARTAAEKGIKRFVYVSSISVHGNSTGDRPYIEEDESRPHSSYAVSKWEGELALQRIAEKTGMELVIVRPPLVYGPGVGGNFLRLMHLAARGLPLPLGNVQNLRSFIGIENLVDMLVRCVEHPRAAGETFLVADGEDLSTPDLIRRVARLMDRPARVFSFPVKVLRAVGLMLGMSDVLDRLCNSLQVDSTKARTLLKWKPQVSLDEGLDRTVKWYMERNNLGENCER